MKQAWARLATELAASSTGRARTRVCVLRSGWPLMLRTTSPLAGSPLITWACRGGEAARVHLAAGAAGPLGGDLLGLDVRVGAGSALVLGEVAPTLLLPGPHGEESRLEVRVHVGTGATLAWLPELVIAARDCRHVTDVLIVLEAGARLVLREEVLFGRHGERPGDYRQRLRVVSGHGPVYDQELGAGSRAPGWDGPAVTAGNRTAGTVLVVDPDVPATSTGRAALRGPDSALMELPGGGLLFSALAPDTGTLRRRLDGAIDRLLAGPGSGPPGPAPAGPYTGIRTRVSPGAGPRCDDGRARSS